jgi:hypothetical protein
MIYSLSLYATAWILSGSWVTALPAPVFFTLARFDMTRVEFTVPLRESFALPFWALQLAILTKYFKSSTVHDAKYTAGLCFGEFFIKASDIYFIKRHFVSRFVGNSINLYFCYKHVRCLVLVLSIWCRPRRLKWSISL